MPDKSVVFLPLFEEIYAGLSTVEMTSTLIYIWLSTKWGFPGNSDGKESACNSGDSGSLGRGNGYPLLYSCLENFMDRGAWQARVHKVAKSQS